MSSVTLSGTEKYTAAAMHNAPSGTELAKDNLRKALNEKDEAKFDRAAHEFEAVFMTEMLKPMFEGIEANGTFGGGRGEEVFRGFMLQEYGKTMAERGSLGIAAHVKAEMIRMQEQKQETQ